MMRKEFLGIWSCVLIAYLFSCSNPNTSYQSDNLEISPLSENTFIHKSYLKTDDFGNVACNGLIYLNDNEVIIFDTPTNDDASNELINWVQDELEAEIVAVIISHSHDDCLGGLQVFHNHDVPSFANALTIALATEAGMTPPKKAFTGELSTSINDTEVLSQFLGEGHTRDNIVSYIPDEEVLFGGCLIKALGAGEGYTGEANLSTWSVTVQKVKDLYPKVKYVVPGHGKTGDKALLDYTIEMFNKYQ